MRRRNSFIWGLPEQKLRPGKKARAICRTMPTEPGIYQWSEWGTVEVFTIGRGKKLYVTPPRGVTIPITPFLAGNFKLLEATSPKP